MMHASYPLKGGNESGREFNNQGEGAEAHNGNPKQVI
jgi:hypothetical protein